MLLFDIAYLFFSVGVGGAACYGLFYSISQLLEPFFGDLDFPDGERLLW